MVWCGLLCVNLSAMHTIVRQNKRDIWLEEVNRIQAALYDGNTLDEKNYIWIVTQLTLDDQ